MCQHLVVPGTKALRMVFILASITAVSFYSMKPMCI